MYIQCPPDQLAGALQRLNEDITAIVEWATAQSLQLNPKKTQLIC